MEYTPDVYDAFRVLDWDGETKRTGFVVGGEDDDGGERYTDVEMSSELIHPFFLSTHSVLQLEDRIG